MNQNVVYYGLENDLPQVIDLCAGPLRLLYENGSLRHIKLGEIEIVRKIYFALRDQNWTTIEGKLENEIINIRTHSFDLEFSSKHQTDEVDYIFNCRITGDENGNISFEIKGLSKSEFYRNRIGFCILHPIKECAGEKIKIIHPDEKFREGIFPVEISANQPFINIQEMIWWPKQDLEVKLAFDGDIFEMEDQRNWTDTSYKTYGTPLELPYPVEVKRGDTIQQRASLAITEVASEINVNPDQNVFKIDSSKIKYKLPEIGLGPTNEKFKISKNECNLLNKLDLDFIRVDIDMDQIIDDDCLIHLNNASMLKLPIHLGMHFGKNPIIKLNEKINLFNEYLISKCIIFDKYSKCTSDQLIDSVVPELREKASKVEIGIGTNIYFTELNRFTPTFKKVDFVIYSINPQVHANDNLTLVENLKAQTDTVYSCKKLADKLPVHVSPITLKPRFNPDASGPEVTPPPGTLPSQVDPRQMSLFGAGWTLGSIQNLTYGNTDSIAFYEPIGWRGIIQGDQPPENPEKFKAKEGEVFPMYFVFYWITKLKKHYLLSSESSNPLLFSGLSFSTDDGIKIMICNHSNTFLRIRIQSDYYFNKFVALDEKNVIAFMNYPDQLLNKIPENLPESNIVTIRPYGLTLLS